MSYYSLDYARDDNGRGYASHFGSVLSVVAAIGTQAYKYVTGEQKKIDDNAAASATTYQTKQNLLLTSATVNAANEAKAIQEEQIKLAAKVVLVVGGVVVGMSVLGLLGRSKR